MCKVDEKDLIEENEELDLSELLDSLTSDNELIPMDLSNVEEMKPDKASFSKGVKDYSYIAGAVTILMNSGLSAELALECVMSREAIDMNITLQDRTNKANVDIAKLGSVQVERNTI